MLTIALLACGSDAPSGSSGPTSCGPTYADLDGDGFGDPATASTSCEVDPARIADGTDCDDGSAAVHPGAAQACDEAQDNDCDGVPDPEELDRDGDGFSACASDCDDDDPSVGPLAAEICNDGVDDDCDGLVDLADDSADLATCWYCPDPADYPLATFDRITLNPCLLDPTVSLCRTDPKDPDTHEDGARLHRLVRRSDGFPPRPELLVMLPPGPGNGTEDITDWAAYAGYNVISLGWHNLFSVPSCMPDDACFDHARGMMAYGDPAGPVYPNDSIVGRLETLLAYLVVEQPTVGWDAWYDPATGIRWDEVVVAGWSEGGGQSAYLGRDFPLDGIVAVSSPGDTTLDAYGIGTPASWQLEPRATPTCAQFGFYHEFEVNNPDNDMFLKGFEALGMVGPAVDSVEVPAPYGGAQILTTRLVDPDFVTECTPHEAMGVDNCTHDDLLIPYLYMYCRAGEIDVCP